MFSIKYTDEFKAWLFGLKDGLTHRRLARRLEKAQNGKLGDVKPVRDGVFEMREHFVMLGGGDKSSQSADIAKAVKLAATIEE